MASPSLRAGLLYRVLLGMLVLLLLDAGLSLYTALHLVYQAYDRELLGSAETLSRSVLTRQILVAMVLPQLALLLGALALSWWSISRGLQPLTRVAELLRRRGPDSLERVEERNQPEEARVLVQRLNELLARVAETVVAQRRFVDGAAHQLRTPLAAVALHADRLAHLSIGDGAWASVMAQLQTSVRRSSRAVNQLLTLARSEPGAVVHGEFKRTDLARLCREVSREWMPRALELGKDFGLDVPDANVWIYGHEGLLAELLANLLDNSFRYGGERGTVTLGIRQAGAQRVDLVVEDDGPGVAPELRARVFERFYRAKGAVGPGCGLGLAIVREIAYAHDSEVRLDSSPELQGARFIVPLQLAKEGPAAGDA